MEKSAGKSQSYKQVIKVDDTPLAYFLTSRWANRLLPWAVEKGLSPNQVTAASLASSGLVALCFVHGSAFFALIGSILLIISFTLDCLDGQLARYTGKTTPFGFWLDIFGDRFRELGLWVCLCLGYSRRTGDMHVWMWGMLAAIALCLRFTEGLYREKALEKMNIKRLTVADEKQVSARVWIQRFFYFSIAERIFVLAIAAPLGLALIFFKIITASSVIMTIVFSVQGWYKERKKAFSVKSGENLDGD